MNEYDFILPEALKQPKMVNGKQCWFTIKEIYFGATEIEAIEARDNFISNNIGKLAEPFCERGIECNY